MKHLFIAILMFSAVPVFAQDSLSYEELPECFFEVKEEFVVPNVYFQESETRFVAIDTCESSSLLNMEAWPLPVNDIYNMITVSSFRDSLLSYNKIYSNHIYYAVYKEMSESIFKAEEQYELIKLGNIEDVKDELTDIITIFETLKEELGSYEIYLHDIKSIGNSQYEALGFSLVFEHFVSVKYVIDLFSDSNIKFKDIYFDADFSDVEEQKRFLVEQNSNTIELTNIQNLSDIKIYDIRGALLASFENIHTTTYVIDISSLSAGVYFLQTPEGVVKFIKTQE